MNYDITVVDPEPDFFLEGVGTQTCIILLGVRIFLLVLVGWGRLWKGRVLSKELHDDDCFCN